MADNGNYGPKFATQKGIIHWPHLFEKETEGQFASGDYCVTVSFDKIQDKAAITHLTDKMNAWGVKKFDKKQKYEITFRDGDKQLKADGTKNSRFEGRMFVKLKSQFKPVIKDQGLNVLDTDDPDVMSGAMARISVTPCSYVFQGQPGVTLKLGNVQIFKGQFDDRFGTDDGFEKEEVPEDAESPTQSYADDEPF